MKLLTALEVSGDLVNLRWTVLLNESAQSPQVGFGCLAHVRLFAAARQCLRLRHTQSAAAVRLAVLAKLAPFVAVCLGILSSSPVAINNCGRRDVKTAGSKSRSLVSPE